MSEIVATAKEVPFFVKSTSCCLASFIVTEKHIDFGIACTSTIDASFGPCCKPSEETSNSTLVSQHKWVLKNKLLLLLRLPSSEAHPNAMHLGSMGARKSFTCSSVMSAGTTASFGNVILMVLICPHWQSLFFLSQTSINTQNTQGSSWVVHDAAGSLKFFPYLAYNSVAALSLPYLLARAHLFSECIGPANENDLGSVSHVCIKTWLSTINFSHPSKWAN